MGNPSSKQVKNERNNTMPYINQKVRKLLNDHIDAMLMFTHEKGEYNYIITRLIHHFIKSYNATFKRVNYPCYDSLNDAVGILECAKQELLRTVVGPCEESKRKANGNISVLDMDKE